MVTKTSKPVNIITKSIAYFLTATFAVLCVLPMWHVIMASVSDPITLSVFKGFLFKPLSFSLQGYDMLFNYSNLIRSYLNTIFYTVSATTLGLLLSLLGAYVLSRKDVRFKKGIMIFIIITMLFSGGIIPFYLVVKALGLTNNPLGLILPTCCNAMSIVMLKNGMESVPESISEAARIDGAGHMRILIKIIIPLTSSFIAVVVLFNAIGQWNSWVNASMFITIAFQEYYPLQLVMRDILINNSTTGILSPEGYPISFYLPSLRAVIVIVGSLPLIIAYPFMQKHFEKGIIIGGVKG